MTLARQLRVAARLDLAEIRRSRWIVFGVGVYAALAGVLVLVGMRESTLLGFTGAGRVLLAFSHALVLILPLLALTATAQLVGRARDDGGLELLLTQPLSRGAWLAGVTATRLAALVVPLVAVTATIALYGQSRGQVIPWGFVARILLTSTALLWCFVGVGMAISVLVRHQARAITYAILVWGIAVALLDAGLIGLMLTWRMNAHAVFVLAALNPVEDARLSLLAGLEPDLGTLGPVGFYLATRIGATWLGLLGLVWPVAVGTLSWLAALAAFRRRDIT